jgi:predicted Rossmann-fold nucleotide-binding protein
MNIGVFLSASDLDELYTQPTREFGELIGRAGHTLVWDTDEMTFARDLAERKARLLTVSDARAVMPGGVGTLDEATEVLELRKHGLYDKPVVLLNTAGFYDGLIVQLRRMDEQGFLPLPLAELVFIADTAAGALAYLEKSVGTDDGTVTARLPARQIAPTPAGPAWQLRPTAPAPRNSAGTLPTQTTARPLRPRNPV